MNRILKEARCALAMCAAALVLAALPCSAATTSAIQLSDGLGNSVTVDSTGAVTFSAGCTNCATTSVSTGTPGLILWSGTLGGFTIMNAKARSSSFFGAPAIDLELGTVTSSTGGTLTGAYTNTNLMVTGPVGLTTQTGGGLSTYTAYLDPSNTAFGTGPGTQVDQIANVTGPTNSDVCPVGQVFPCIATVVNTQPASLTVVAIADIPSTGQYTDDLEFLASTIVPSIPPSLLCSPVNSAQVGKMFTSTVTAVGGTPPYNFTVVNATVPIGTVGLTLAEPTGNGTTATISGTPTGLDTFYIQVTDANLLTAVSKCPYTIGQTPSACVFNYPTGTAPALSSVVFNESGVLQAFASSPDNSQIRAWYSDEHAPLLGARAVTLISSGGTNTTNYPFTTYNMGTMGVLNPTGPLAVGTTARNGTMAGTDTALQSSAYCFGVANAAPCNQPYAFSGRPLWPSLFITDLTVSGAGSTIGDWQQGGTAATPPNGIYGVWKGAVVTIDQTKSPSVMSVTTDADPAANNNSGTPAGIPDTPPGGFGQNLGYFTEAVWNVNSIGLVPGHTYRIQAIVHDGDQNNSGGDVGEGCLTGVTLPISPLTLSCASGTGNVGTPYTSGLVAAGGVGSYVYSIVGTLPPGLTLNPSTGAITGIPSLAGTYNFVSQVKDASGNIVNNQCTIVIGGQLPLSLLCSPVTTGETSTAFNSPGPSVIGGVAPYTFSVVGTLPLGLTLNPSTGAITGIPTTVGVFNIKVTDSQNSSITSTCGYTITSCLLTKLGSASPFSILGLANAKINVQATLPGGSTIGVGAGGQLHIQGNTVLTNNVFADTTATIQIDGGASDTGNTSTESFAGIQSSVTTASSVFAALTPTKTFTQDINSSATITGNGGQNVILLNNAQINLNTGNNLTIVGGPNDTFIFNITQGKGLTLANGASIILSGVSPSQVVFNFTGNGNVQIQSNNAGSSNTAGIFIDPLGQINIQGGTHNSTFISGNQIQIQPGPQPPPTPPAPPAPGTPPAPPAPPAPAVGPTVTPLVCNGMSSLTLACPVAAATLGGVYESGLVATGGNVPYTYSITSGSLPPGLTLNPATGAITGTASTVGAYTFTSQVVDSASFAATSSCSITVTAAPLTLACPGSVGQAGGPYSSSLVAMGGVPPYTYAVSTGLPAGLTLNASTGAITGVITGMAGNDTFSAKAVDSSGNSVTGIVAAGCSITVGAQILKLTKTASPTNPGPFVPVTYSYVVTNLGPNPLSNIVVTDDNGTPNDPSDDHVVGTIASLAGNTSAPVLTWTTYPPYAMTVVDQKLGTIPGGTLVIQNVAAGLKVTFNQSLGLNDNSYGNTSSPAWGSHGHQFQDLTGSDMAEFQFFTAASPTTPVLDFSMDYISAATAPAAACPNANFASYPSGYGTLGSCGGDGKSPNPGNQSWIVSSDTTLTDDLNQSKAFNGFTTNSPAQGTPGWNFVDGYSVIISPLAFGSSTFSSLKIPVIHNSPSINSTDMVAPTVGASTVTNTATAVAGNGLAAIATATVTVHP